MKILVVDDEIHVAAVLTDAIRANGHEVIAAQDAEEALALLRHYRPDAVFLDVCLKELSGIDLLRRIRRTDDKLPVVLVTGHATREELAEAAQLGVADIIEKPFGLARLSDALGAAEQSR